MRMMMMLKGALTALLLCVFLVPAKAEVKRLEDAEEKGGHVFVKEDNRLFNLSPEVDRVTIITSTEVIRVWSNGNRRKPKVIDYSKDDFMTPARAVKENFSDGYKTVDATLITSIESGENVDTEYDVIVQVNRDRWGIQGKNTRIIASSRDGGSTLGNYPIHYEDIPEVLGNLCETIVSKNSPNYLKWYSGKAIQALKIMEYIQMVYSDKRFEKGGFVSTSRYLTNHMYTFHVNDGRFGYNHPAMHFLAVAIYGKNMLRYKRGKQMKFEEVYNAYNFLHFTALDYWNQKGFGRGNLDSEKAIQNRLRSWKNPNQHRWTSFRGIMHVLMTTKRLQEWEDGELPNAPSSKSQNHFGIFMEEMNRLPRTVVPTQFHRVTTWGNIKKGGK